MWFIYVLVRSIPDYDEKPISQESQLGEYNDGASSQAAL